MNRPARSDYRTVIVGAGIVGLFTAYHLSRAGAGPVLVLDRGFLSSGASGRNGGGVRQQWQTRATIRLARESVAAYRRFGADFGYNIWFRQGGYLFLADSETDLARLRGVNAVVRSEGLDARMLDPEGIVRIAPEIDPTGLAGGAFLRTDGTLYPFPAVWGVYEAVRRLGGEVVLGLEAHGVRAEGGRVVGVRTDAGEIATSSVVNAAGGWSGEFGARSNLPAPNQASRHEILATEPLKPFLDPMVVRLGDGLYFSQTMRGEIVGGLTLHHPPGTQAGVPTSTTFLRTFARAMVGLVPALRNLGVLRAWSGFYDDTPDGLPLIGADPRLSGFFHANGFGGHGFMLAPATTKRVAQSVLGEPTDLDPALFGPGRFRTPGRTRAAERFQLG